MRRVIYAGVPAIVTCVTLLSLAVAAQTKDTGKGKEQEEPKQYIRVSVGELEQNPAAFRDRDIQVADYFSEPIEQFPQEIRRMGFSPDKYRAFLTDRTEGSNLLCLVARDNDEARDFFQTPLVPQTRIYLMGKVGSQVVLRNGVTTVFTVDRITRGHNPPPPRSEKKKPLLFTIEWVVAKPDGTTQVQSKEYKIPEPGRYEFPDPYDKTKKLYMTFHF